MSMTPREGVWLVGSAVQVEKRNNFCFIVQWVTMAKNQLYTSK